MEEQNTPNIPSTSDDAGLIKKVTAPGQLPSMSDALDALESTEQPTEQPTEESSEQNYDLKKIENLAKLESGWRDEKTGLTEKLSVLTKEIEALKALETVDSYKDQITKLAKRNPKKLLEQFGADAELYLDQHMGIVDVDDDDDDDGQPKSYTNEDIDRIVAEKLEASLKSADEQRQKTELDNKVTAFQNELGDLIKTPDYPIMAKIGTDQHISDCYGMLAKNLGRSPTAKEVLSACETYFSEELGQVNPTNTQRTLSNSMSSPGKQVPAGQANLSDEDFLRNLVDNLS